MEDLFEKCAKICETYNQSIVEEKEVYINRDLSALFEFPYENENEIKSVHSDALKQHLGFKTTAPRTLRLQGIQHGWWKIIN